MTTSPTNAATIVASNKKGTPSETKPSPVLQDIHALRLQTAKIQIADKEAIMARVQFAHKNNNLGIVADNIRVLLEGTKQNPKAEHPRDPEQIYKYKTAISLFITSLVETIGTDATRKTLDDYGFSKKGMDLKDPANKWFYLETNLILIRNAHRPTMGLYADSISLGDTKKFNDRFEAMVNKILPGGQCAIDVFMQEMANRNDSTKIESAIEAIEDDGIRSTISKSWERVIAERTRGIGELAVGDREEHLETRSPTGTKAKPKHVDRYGASPAVEPVFTTLDRVAKQVREEERGTGASKKQLTPSRTPFTSLSALAVGEGGGRGA